MAILHLFSNYKRTGPADLAVELAAAQAEVGEHDVLFASPDPKNTPQPEAALQTRARELGLAEPTLQMQLPKHLKPFSLWQDTTALRRWLRDDPVGRRVTLIHCHLRGDHLTGGRAARKALVHDRRQNGGPLVVRSLYDIEAGTQSGKRADDRVPRLRWRDRYAMARLSDGVIGATPSITESATERFGIPAARAFTVEPGLQVERFQGQEGESRAAARQRLGLSPQAFVVGVVARIQPHRRFEVILQALSRLRARGCDARLLVLGRGTRAQEVGVDPARALGLDESIALFPGYQAGDAYVGSIRAMDTLVYLVPGSDGSCRAVREAMSANLAPVVSHRGTLPEIVRDGETGLVFQEPEDVQSAANDLADVLQGLASNPDKRQGLGAAAGREAAGRFGAAGQARQVLAAYEKISALGPRLSTRVLRDGR